MTAGYRLISYRHAGEVQAGVLVDGLVYPAAKLAGDIASASSVIGVLKAWAQVHPRLDAASRGVSGGIPLDGIELLAPILYPGALFCAGANYWDHLEEMAEIARQATGKVQPPVKPPEPFMFMKTAASSIIGHGTPARLPKLSSKVDWEAELGVVIGRPTRDVSEAEALDCIAGYLVINDLSARDFMKRENTPFVFDWLAQKCFDDSAPMGPWLTPAAYVGDPNDLAIKLWVNGELKQNSNSGRMVHGIAEQIAYLSRRVTLQPGDVIATGTPAGVGMPRGEFLKAGDEVTIEIAGCGRLTNRMVADDR